MQLDTANEALRKNIDALDVRVTTLEDKNINRKILWLGTSIPEFYGNKQLAYPNRACKILGHKCYNMSLGSSGFMLRSGVLGTDRDGKDLCESAAEKVARYSEHIGSGEAGSGTVTQERYDAMMQWGYDKRIIPYIDGTIDSCDTIVFDHGYNDMNFHVCCYYAENLEKQDFSISKPDSEYDRAGNPIEAFCFLVHKIWEVNPRIKIIICSYLENISGKYEKSTVNGMYVPTSDSFANLNHSGIALDKLLRGIAKHFGFPYLNMCDFNGFNFEFVPNTQDFINEYNTQYGTSISNINYTGKDNPNGLVTKFQMMCPDGVHPHSDKTGYSSDVLTSSIVHLLRDL